MAPVEEMSVASHTDLWMPLHDLQSNRSSLLRDENLLLVDEVTGEQQQKSVWKRIKRVEYQVQNDRFGGEEVVHDWLRLVTSDEGSKDASKRRWHGETLVPCLKS